MSSKIYLLILAALSVVYGRSNIRYKRTIGHHNQQVSGTTYNLGVYGNFDASSQALSSRFGSGFTADQFLSTGLSRGTYPVGYNNIYKDHGDNSYGFVSGNEGHFPSNRLKRFAVQKYVSKNSYKEISQALYENRKVISALIKSKNEVQGGVIVVDKHNSNVGKGLAENERLTNILQGFENGGRAVVVKGDILDMENSRIGKGLAENDRLNKVLNEKRSQKNKIAIQGPQQVTMNKIRNANAILRQKIEQAKQKASIEYEQTMQEIRKENAKLRQDIAEARRLGGTNSIGLTAGSGVTVLNKHTSNVGKGMAETKRLNKLLHDIEHGGETLLLHGYILNMRTDRIGMGLTENKRLNNILNEIIHGKDTIAIKGSPAEKMKEIRNTNALLRTQIAEADRKKQIEVENTMKQIRQENAKLRNQIAQH